MAVRMDAFHSYFREEFSYIYINADGRFHTQGLSLSSFLRKAQGLSHHLDMHHKIEEIHIFPILAKKMPQFKVGVSESGEHLKSHKLIHEGLENYDSFLSTSLRNPSSYNPTALRAIMDSFKDVLFKHLDEEVKDLRGESMRAAGWTLEEFRRIVI
ncbi:hypothetical protein TREMEDRAFT_33693 [Tremella mesenterica DSM 1558]|uniref:uncharacterized protein n=1 Tax=Tremella mesenterica (strain ATCC 24925 / CBS 8224 / DSM 1558 / NBRC 9311 / NRRL Y-6157 / RJB 2259-6 / UBC 559-6) TaxID=578456 RepID=UPI0003F49608|nr:uncharacterized protein TREMEDRAFT_33693 [Tremella mesenterica DSM 1558]EIW67380.1 hypothetical protein TREMEDRAFT_33693 [Tremella mesenterica DSM 1558]